MNHFVVSLFIAFCLLPLPTPARPVTHMLVARQDHTSRIDSDLIFGITFSLALLFVLLGSFAWLATGRTVAQLFEILNRICSTFIALAQRLSEFRFSSLIERASATILDATDAGTANMPRRGGASYPVATVSRGRVGRVQSGGPGRLGGTQGGGDLLAFAPST